MLTKKQLKQITEIIRRRFLSFTYEAFGDRALTEDEINELKRIGLLRGSTRSMIADGYTIGRVASSLERIDAKGMSFDEILRAATKLPKTKVETAMVDWASTHAGEYIKGISDDMVKEVSAVAARSTGSAIRAIASGVASAIEARKTPSELKTMLFDTIDDNAKDWARVASTELNNAIQSGIYSEIVANHGASQLVYKRPSPNACKHCKRVYLKPDGITPRVFVISDLDDDNFGKKAAEWTSTIVSVHPWCQCQLMMIPDGYDFVKRATVKQPFKIGEKHFKKGQILTQSELDALPEEERNKTGLDAILEFTGETAKPDTTKSMAASDIGHGHDDDCACEY
jgi:hypothetical protein